jgi:F-type H+-transporting ATPase subunit epsilon
MSDDVTTGGKSVLAVSLVAADRKVWTGTAAMVIARTTEGDTGVMPGHQPILSILLPSVVTVRAAAGSGAEDFAAVVSGGFLSVDHNKVSILAESVLLPAEIDTDAAQALLASAREAERAAESAHDKDALEQAEADIRFAESQLRVARGGVELGH